MPKQNTPVDVQVMCEGSIFLFDPQSKRAKEWLLDNVQSEPWQWFAGRLVVDQRMARGLAQVMLDAGLCVR